jgi:L-ascorbate metabolism protein UlaG (beta-lactamase superfamily)
MLCNDSVFIVLVVHQHDLAVGIVVLTALSCNKAVAGGVLEECLLLARQHVTTFFAGC